jgi:hypothetical protein
MVAAQDGDSLAYRRLLAEVAMRAMEAYVLDGAAQQLAAGDRDAFACRVLHTVHAALSTFDPNQSFDVWLGAIISTHLARSQRRRGTILREARTRVATAWYRRLLARGPL